jgi:hypothetical protein
MNEERANDRDAIDMNQTPELQHLFDAEGHLTNTALNDSIDGSLSGRQAGLVSAHLTGCDSCSTRRNELDRTIALIGSLPEVSPGRSFEIAPQPPREMESPAKPWLQTVISPAFPALRVAVAAVFLLLVGVTATDLITQPDNQGDQVAMIADTPAARTEPVMRDDAEEAPEATEEAPAPAANMQVEEAEQALPTGEPSQAFDQAAPDEDLLAGEAQEAEQATGGDGAIMAEPAAAPSPEPSPTASEPVPESRVDAAEESDGLSNWRVAEIALLLLLFWLVVTWFGLERMRNR